MERPRREALTRIAAQPVALGQVLLLAGGLLFCGCEGAASSGSSAVAGGSISRSLLPLLDDAGQRGTDQGAVTLRALEIAGQERAAIWAPTPATARFSNVAIGQNARLNFGIGMRRNGAGGPADGVDFSVVVEDAGLRTEVWRRTLDPGGGYKPAWIDATATLAAFEGRTVDLLFVTDGRANGTGDLSAWSHPVIYEQVPVGGRAVLPIRRERLVQGLRAGERTVLAIPNGGSLNVAGQVVLRGGPAPPNAGVTFRIRAGESLLFNYVVRPATRLSDFGQTIDLSAHAGQNVGLELTIDVPAALQGRVDARWLQAALMREEAVSRQPAGGGPNLLLVVVDTLRSDHLGLFGYHRDTSPVLDALARDSAVFTHALSASSWTMPATASLLSGLSPIEHGVTDGVPLVPEIETLAERLQGVGMATFGVSANPLVDRAAGFDQGHETFLYLPWARAETVNDVVARLVDASAASRWFGYVHYIDPHDPYAAPKPFATMFQADVESPLANDREFARLVDAINFGIGEANADAHDIAYLQAAYDGEIRYWDTQFGLLLDELEAGGHLENTIIVITADHGEEFLEHGRLKHGQHLYEESIRVPLIVRAPGRIAAAYHEDPVETRRLLELCLELLSPAKPGSVDPIELLRPDDGLVFSYSGHAVLAPQRGRTALVAVREGRWKAIWYPETKHRELYDLVRDPTESTDLAATPPPGLLGRYSAALDAWLQTPPFTEMPIEKRQGILERLRALGYIR